MTKRLGKERMKLEKEINDSSTSISEYIQSVTQPEDDNIFIWDVKMSGPARSPYAGGTFLIRLTFPTNYPFKSPSIHFQTKIYHPSIQTESGEVCNAVLGTWGPTLTVQHVLTTLYGLLQSPSGDHPYETDIAEVLQNKPKEFEKNAKKFTKQHAFST